MVQEYLEDIICSTLFNGVPKEQIYEIISKLAPDIIHYKKNDIIRREAELQHDIGLILSGEVWQLVIKQNGERAIYEHLTKGQVFGDVVMFSPKKKVWPFDSVAKTDCTIMFFKKSSLIKEQQDNFNIMNQFYMNMISSICTHAEKMLIALQCAKTRTVRQKIATFLYENMNLQGGSGVTQMTLGYNRNELADILFIPRPSLSREMAKMKKDGIIDFYRFSVKILDMDALNECL